MYKIYVDGVLFYDSTLEHLQIESGTITRELNKAGAFKFAIYPTHPHYDLIRELKSIIEVYKDGIDEPIFRGRALYPETDFFKKKTYTCEGHLNFLLDSIKPKFSWNSTKLSLFRNLIENHNSQVEADKHFLYASSSVRGSAGNPSETTAQTTQEVINKCLLDKFGGYIVPFKKNGVWYIKYIDDFTEKCSQVIEFGENLTKFTRKDNYADIITALMPFGSDDLTISSVNSGKTIITDATGVSLYGTIIGTETFSDISNASTLLSEARAFLSNAVKKKITIEVNAIDLSLLNASIEPLKIGTYCRIISEPHSLDDWFLVTKQTIDLTDPTKDSVVLGGEFTTFTDQTSKAVNAIKNIDSTVNKAVDNSPTVQNVVQKVDELEKHSGSYTGNGDATSRTVDIGATGSVLNIKNDVNMAFVWPGGAVVLSSTGIMTGLPNTEIQYVNGVLTLTTTSELVNATDQTYEYFVL